MIKNQLAQSVLCLMICIVMLSGCGQGADDIESLESSEASFSEQTTDIETTNQPESTTPVESEKIPDTTEMATKATVMATTTVETTVSSEMVTEEKQNGQITEYNHFYDLPQIKVDFPEEITDSTFIQIEDSEFTGHVIGYSDSRYGLGIMLRKGPSQAFSYVSDDFIPYKEAVDIYASCENFGLSTFAYNWLYVCYNGVWGWCPDYDLTNNMDDLIDTTGITMPDKYYTNDEIRSNGNYYTKTADIEVKSSFIDDSETLYLLEENDRVEFLGSTQPESSWKFISYYDADYREKLGWINDPDNNLFYTEDEYYELYPERDLFKDMALKPAIYLYPEKPTNINVKLRLHGLELSTTYPKYNDGWNVTAYPDGRIVNQADNCQYDYLFWDAVNHNVEYDLSSGFCVKGEDTEAFLREKLTYLGLNESEMNEFIVFWLPLMEHEKYNLVTFQTECYTKNAELLITPKPDSLLRVFMTTQPLDTPINIEPQKFEHFERKGFTAIEWGGSKLH